MSFSLTISPHHGHKMEILKLNKEIFQNSEPHYAVITDEFKRQI